MWRKVKSRKFIMFAIDTGLMLCISLLTYFFVNLTKFVNLELLDFKIILPSLLLLNLFGLLVSGSYNIMWKYANLKDIMRCANGILIGTVLFYIFVLIAKIEVSDVYIISTAVLYYIGTVAVRVVYRLINDYYLLISSAKNKKRTLIVGAGVACRSILVDMFQSKSELTPVCIVDDDPNKISRTLNGIKIYGPISNLPEIVKKQNINTILFAIPSCSDDDRRRILNICSSTDCSIKIIPQIHMLTRSSRLINQIKDVNIEDLLGRDIVTFKDDNIIKLIRDKVCMVTGGGGSIGSELCRQIAKCDPSQLIVLDIYENNAYEIQQELIRHYGKTLNLIVKIASVRDHHEMNHVFNELRPDIVFHAAAHKHVPLMESNPGEAVKNNIFGTFNIADMCDKYRVTKMVLISTDKAVNPTNVMGATKRCCEMIMQYMAQKESITDFITVRFGNVLGSNGSVIPLFQKQIQDGGPVTVTHPDIIRYFMTIPESVSLVLQAGAISRGGQILVLDMGEPVKITNLAENLIKLCGYEPYTEIPIEFTGLRPGEKLYEELLMKEEGLKSTLNQKIFIANQIRIDPIDFSEQISGLRSAASKNETQTLINILQSMVPTFDSSSQCNTENIINLKEARSKAKVAT